MAKRKPIRRPAELTVLEGRQAGGEASNTVTASTTTNNEGTGTGRILGIDPGLGTTGYCIIEGRGGCGRRPRLVEAGIIRATRASHTEEGELSSRLLEIFQSLVEIIEQYRPEAIALEALYSHYKRPMTAVIMGHARGVICLAGAQAGIPVISYAATQVKRILTGSGRATKEQVQRAVQFELNLTTVPDPPDIADATALAIAHCYAPST